jgi:acyl dehydratase
MTESSNQVMEDALTTLKTRIGNEQPPGDWVEMTQEMVNKFADATGDHQWIHVDVDRAKKGPFGAPIAHGQLTLSILGILGRNAAPTDETEIRIEGQKMGINYGFNRVRFPSPVPVGSMLRARRVLKTAEIKGGMIETMTEVTVEIEGGAKPACVAESMARMVF